MTLSRRERVISEWWMTRFYSEWDTTTRYDVCLYCDGTGHAPSADNRTPCGFCHGGDRHTV